MDEVEQNIVICLWRAEQINCLPNPKAEANDLRDTDKSRYFAITEFNNIICSQTQLDGIAHEQTITCRQLFAGHVVGSRPMKREKHLLRIITINI